MARGCDISTEVRFLSERVREQHPFSASLARAAANLGRICRRIVRAVAKSGVMAEGACWRSDLAEHTRSCARRRITPQRGEIETPPSMTEVITELTNTFTDRGVRQQSRRRNARWSDLE